MVEPVAQTVGVALVYLGDGHVDVKALVDLFLTRAWGEDDAYSQNVVDLLEGDVLVLHLVPDGIGRLDTLLYLVLDAHRLEGIFDRFGETVEEFVALGLRQGQFLLDGSILLGMFKLETEVF